MKIKYMKKCLLLMGFCIAQAAYETIDLSRQRLSNFDIAERLSQELRNHEADKKYFFLILSNNHLDDDAMEKIAKILNADNGKFAKKLLALDITNNRLSNECFEYVFPLLEQAEELQWINLAINMFDTTDYGKFFHMLGKYVKKDAEKQDELAGKVVWLPNNYNIKLFFIEGSPFHRAHIKCYKTYINED